MRPAPIPDNEIWEGATRTVFAAPNGDLTDDKIRPVEALVDRVEDGTRRICVRLILEDGDLDKLAEGSPLWLAFYGALVPFVVDVIGVTE